MKQLQAIIGIPSAILLLLGLYFSYQPLLYIALAGCFAALVIRQVRLHKYSYMLGHPDRRYDESGYDASADPLDQAETYAAEEEEREK
ncbi:hypothetical protein [Jeotgalibacillus terrae]|uniref:ATP-dependent Lon protease n=1 Tax=Jeotgalibacillus terrae TaxID=587735 RepID=A0ABW5ZM08_9BACL|nr:hypothetical protein [Jeotgalibacillus terrae]MBM7578158.1 hypothetical protein [Jeotgalibacillus terrae]